MDSSDKFDNSNRVSQKSSKRSLLKIFQSNIKTTTQIKVLVKINEQQSIFSPSFLLEGVLLLFQVTTLLFGNKRNKNLD